MASSLFYPRTVTIKRPVAPNNSNSEVGLAGYSGMAETPASADAGNQGETLLFSGLAADIQAARTGRKRGSELPSDAVYSPTWKIYLAAGAASLGAVRDRDLVYDDEGYRYEVAQAYWNSLGYCITCIRLEA